MCIRSEYHIWVMVGLWLVRAWFSHWHFAGLTCVFVIYQRRKLCRQLATQIPPPKICPSESLKFENVKKEDNLPQELQIWGRGYCRWKRCNISDPQTPASSPEECTLSEKRDCHKRRELRMRCHKYGKQGRCYYRKHIWTQLNYDKLRILHRVSMLWNVCKVNFIL